MRGIRIVVANEPRSYREVIAATFQERRPECEVTLVDPEDLDRAVERCHPHLVVCSRITTSVRSFVFNWALLYPDGANHSVVSVRGQETTLPDIQFDDLLAMIDQATRQARLRDGSDRD